MSERLYKRTVGETTVLQVQQAIPLLDGGVIPGQYDAMCQHMYRELYKGIIEAIGSGAEFYLKWGRVERVRGWDLPRDDNIPVITEHHAYYRLRVEIAPLHEVRDQPY
jgi:hypothetical protein